MSLFRASKETRFRQRSLTSLIKWAISIFVPVIIAGLCVITFIYFNDRSKTADNYKNSLDYQTAQFEGTLNRIKLYAINTIINNENIKQIKENGDPLMAIYFSNQLIEDLSRTRGIVGYNYNFFYYNRTHGDFLSTPSGAISYDKMKQVNDALLAEISSGGRPAAGTRKWSLLKLKDAWYVYNYFQYQDRILGCWTKGDSALAFISSVAGKDDFYVVLNSAGAPVNPDDRYPAGGAGFQNNRSCYYDGGFLVYHSPVRDADFSYVAVRTNIGGFKDIAAVELILLALMGIIVLSAIVLLFFIKRDIVEPVQHFFNDINEYNERKQLKKKGMGFIELEQAVDKFDALAEQIRKLKIDIYEEKIYRQKTELEYLQLQIKPHFFINCLNMIYSMAEKKQYIKIQKLALKISEYMRYYVQSSFDKVSLEEELKHVQGYMDILKIQFGSEMAYECEMEDDTGGCLIPPLILLTLVENSVKHNIFLQEMIKVRVSVQRTIQGDQEKVRIVVADNGTGINSDTLEALNKGEKIMTSGRRRHIGIANTVRRLNMMYDGQADIRFGNAPERGCVVTVHIPCQMDSQLPSPQA